LLTRAHAGADDRAARSERVSRLVQTLLGQAEEAILGADWSAAAQKARSVLALQPGHQEALAYLEAAERTGPVIPPPLHADQPSPTNWTAALAGYRYPVDLRRFQNPPAGFFDCQVDGDPSSTIAFEERFRALAPVRLEAWYEVIFWKLYSQGGRAEFETRRAIDTAISRGLTAGRLWNFCEQFRQEFDEDPRHAKSWLRALQASFFSSQAMATTWTFVAFSDPNGRFPMIDRSTSSWLYDHFPEFTANGMTCAEHLERPPRRFGAGVAGSTVQLSDYDRFVVGWVRWCRCMAEELAGRTAQQWRARDVEMAIFRSADKRDPIPLPPLI